MLAWTAQAAREEYVKTRMEASAPDTGPAAREEAIRQAQVEIVADILKSALASEHFARVKSLLDQTPRYISTTQLMRCNFRDGLVRVEIECYVKRADLMKDAAAMLLPRLPVPPTALVIVLQEAKEGVADADTASKALSKTLKDRGFDLVDTEVVRACHSDEEIATAVQGDNDVAARFARERFADVAILGHADIANAAEAGSLNLVTSTAHVTLRLFRTTDGKLADDLSSEAVIHGVDPKAGADAALQDACTKMAVDLEIAATMTVGGTRATEDILITIEQPGGEDRVKEVLKVATAFAGQDAELLVCTQRLARIRLPYDGAMTPLLDALTGQRYSGATLETQKAIQRNVQMRFLP